MALLDIFLNNQRINRPNGFQGRIGLPIINQTSLNKTATPSRVQFSKKPLLDFFLEKNRFR